MSIEPMPGIDAWLSELKADPASSGVGMYLSHNGIVRAFSRDGREVTGMELSVDRDLLASAVEDARQMPGIVQVRAWVNEGHLEIGDDIMYVLVGGDIRDNVFDALKSLVKTIKTTVVAETELRP